MITRLERDFVAADLSAVENLLETLSPSDIVGRFSLSSRRDELRTRLALLDADENPLAASALFFAGQPVIGSHGIDSEFAADSITKYQDIVSKIYATKLAGELRSAGPIPGKAESRLQVTGVVRGSFGFQFEEMPAQVPFLSLDTLLKDAVEQTSGILRAFGETSEDNFDEAAADIDSRALDAIRNFFTFMIDNRATFRVVSDNVDQSFDDASLSRAITRARVTTIDERLQEMNGTLRGILPSSRQFEFNADNQVKPITGKISKSISEDEIHSMNGLLNNNAHAVILVKSVLRQGVVQRRQFTLQSIVVVS